MKRLIIGFPVFAIAFLVGCVMVPKIYEECSEVTVPVQTTEQSIQTETTPVSISATSKTDDFVPEFCDLPSYEDIAYPEDTNNLIDVFETGAIYRESEVIAKTGEKWLTLFERNGKYSLVTSKTKIVKKQTISFPGDEYDVQLFFDRPGTPVFAVRNMKALKPGSITTLYHRPSWEEIDRRNLPIEAMKTGYKREFNLNEKWYTLRVSQALSKNGTPTGILVLENDGVSQVIAENYHEPGYGEIIGDLLWVGDLDNDGKLDLYFDEFNEKGYFGVGLYLSSSAQPGKLVKLVATFSTAGC